MKIGLYEQLINKELESSNKDNFELQKGEIDEKLAPKIISQYFEEILENALKNLKENNYSVEQQVAVCNELITKIKEVTSDDYYESQIINKKGEMLYAITENRQNLPSLQKRFQNRPYYSLVQPFLFTGAKTDIKLLSELKREILTSDEIDFVVSFIKWSGISCIINDLREFTENGGKLRIITTTYTGATDPKAIEVLSTLKNTEIKISYDTTATRLHAKSYIFKRKTGFSTAYIGSSNISNAALTSGTEWNVKIVEKTMKQLFEKVNASFSIYWNRDDFEYFRIEDSYKLRCALEAEKHPIKITNDPTFFDIVPYSYQKRILDQLRAEREIHNNYRNLVVAATGTGKTVISAFDFKNFLDQNKDKKIKFLFVAHREEILKQSISCFRGILKDHNFGELMVGGLKTDNLDNLFISIQTFNSKKLWEVLDENFYDYIIIDEFHHAAAKGYQKLLSHFKPKVLLGLTATPERMDGKDILEYFNGKITGEIRLPEAIDRNLLVPFNYFGISDDTDLRNVTWTRGKYDYKELDEILSMNKARAGMIVNSLDKYLNDISSVKGLGFCVSKKHAEYMSNVFNEHNIKSIWLDSTSPKEYRFEAQKKLISGEVKFIFVVDLYNEGVDIPEVNTILFLRPTDSLTVFLQQLGRGLRLSKNKDCLTVLDYVGQANKMYSFDNKFKALLENNIGDMKSEVNLDFPHLPKGCSITLEKKAKEYILNNISQSFNNKNKWIERFINFKNETNLELTFGNFFNFYNIKPITLYKSNLSFTLLKSNIDFIEKKEDVNALARISKIDSLDLIKTLLQLLPKLIQNKNIILSDYEKRCLCMLHYTIYSKSPKELGFNDSVQSVTDFLKNKYYKEVKDILDFNFSKIDIVNKPLINDKKCPLQLHCSYSVRQILAGLGHFNDEFYHPMNEGVIYLKKNKNRCFFCNFK